MSILDLSTNLGALKLKNPTILASGVLGLDVATLKRVIKGGAGAVTIKSLTSEPRKGHNNPIFIEAAEGICMNAVGYANKGIDHGVEEFQKWEGEAPLIGSIVAQSPEEFARLAEKIQKIPLQALEIVLSCPHTPGYGLLAGQGSPEATAEITKIVRKETKLPLSVKLSPSIEAIGEVAKAAEFAGADIINMGNTVGPGMRIDINRAVPMLAFKIGGMSGPAIKPITIRSVYDLYKAVKIPIIATGGIMTGEDVIEAIMAGATATGIGTGIYYRGITVFKKVCREIEEWLKKNKVNTLTSLKGIAHQ